jgi:hypothetical protein
VNCIDLLWNKFLEFFESKWSNFVYDTKFESVRAFGSCDVLNYEFALYFDFDKVIADQNYFAFLHGCTVH